MSTVEFSPQERATLARIEAADPAPESWHIRQNAVTQVAGHPAALESLRERVARAIMDADYEQATGGLMDWLDDLDEAERDNFRRLADAALAVIRGEQ